MAVEDYNGNVFMMGLSHGADVNGGTIVTGAAMADLSGYTLTLNAQELEPANFISTSDPTAVDYPFDAMSSASATVVSGTNS